MSTIDNFKTALRGGGLRPNLFSVKLNWPQKIVNSAEGSAVKLTEIGSFLIKAASLPSSIIAPIPVPYRGRKLNVAGDRTFEPWSIIVINDHKMELRTAFEKWMDLINDNESNTSEYGSNNALGYYSNATVTQLDRSGNKPVKTYRFHQMFPTNIQAIDLNYETNDTVEEFTVELTYNYWTTASTSAQTGNA